MTTTINFTWNIVEVGTMLKTMMIRYQRDKENEPPSFLHIAIPRKGETENLDDYIKSHAPIGAWLANDINEVVEYEEIEIGKTGDHIWTPPSIEPSVSNSQGIIPDTMAEHRRVELQVSIQQVLAEMAAGTV